jgi:hypothetical protein
MANSIRERDENSCQACGKEYEKGYLFPVHHMRPVKDDGPDEPWNLVTLCPPCHYRTEAQPGEFKIPHTPSGQPIRKQDELQGYWNDYKKNLEDT